jgi:hypothetical protein
VIFNTASLPTQRLNTESQSASFIGASRAYRHIQGIAINAVSGLFSAQAPLAFHSRVIQAGSRLKISFFKRFVVANRCHNGSPAESNRAADAMAVPPATSLPAESNPVKYKILICIQLLSFLFEHRFSFNHFELLRLPTTMKELQGRGRS